MPLYYVRALAVTDLQLIVFTVFSCVYFRTSFPFLLLLLFAVF